MKFKIKDIIIILIIMMIPFILYIHNLVPKVDSFQGSIFEFRSLYFEDLNFMAWIFFSKIVIVIILLLWYYSNTHWWKYAIIIPLSIEIYKISGLFNQNINYLDEDGLY